MASLGNFTFFFELESTVDKWYGFNATDTKKLRAGALAGESEVELTGADGADFDVSLDSMSHKTPHGFHRRVRFVVQSGGELVTWQWAAPRRGRSIWKGFHPLAVVKLEEARQAGETQVDLTLNGAPVSADLTANSLTGLSEGTCELRRIDCGDSLAASDAPAERFPAKRVKKENVKQEAQEAGSSKKSRASVPAAKKSKKLAVKSEPKRLGLKKVTHAAGTVPVDEECDLCGSASVYVSGGVQWSCMLNQTNIAQNNNKFYIIQLLSLDGRFYTWFRWARVGYTGQMKLEEFGTNLDAAMRSFKKKFWDKSRNEWDERDKFEKVAGKYDLVHVDYGSEDIAPQVPSTSALPDCNLHPKLQMLLQLIFDIKTRYHSES